MILRIYIPTYLCIYKKIKLKLNTNQPKILSIIMIILILNENFTINSECNHLKKKNYFAQLTYESP